jgi:hypothetical protein
MKPGDKIQGKFKVVLTSLSMGGDHIAVRPIGKLKILTRRTLTLSQAMEWLGTISESYVTNDKTESGEVRWRAFALVNNEWQRASGPTPLKAIIALRRKLGVRS